MTQIPRSAEQELKIGEEDGQSRLDGDVCCERQRGHGSGGGQAGGDDGRGEISSRYWSPPRRVEWAAEFLGDVFVLVSLSTDAVTYNVCYVRTTQYRKAQNEPARSTKLGVTLEGHRKHWGKREVVTYSTNATRCGGPEVVHARR